MDRVAIIGMGLMGGSLGLGLRGAGFQGRIVGYARRSETREYAVARGIADEMHAEVADAVTGADLVVVCVPILSTERVVDSALPAVKPGCIVTDVGSTKAWLADRLAGLVTGAGGIFIGSHPIAGSEQQGAEAAVDDLYHGALVALTPEDDLTNAAAVDVLRRFWMSIGARVVVLSPRAHDQVLARTSHLPHMIAAALAATVGRNDVSEETGVFCGSGFRDATRIAEGSPAVWLDILKTNRENVLNELAAFADRLHRLRTTIADMDDDTVEAFLEQAKDTRMELIRKARTET